MSTWFRKLKRLFVRHAAYPELQVVQTARKFFTDYPEENKYKQYHWIYLHDPEVRGCIDKLALLASASFHGYESSQPEKVRELIRQYRIPWWIHQIAKQLLIYGDSVWLKHSMQNLPIFALTIVENRSQIEDTLAQIFMRKLYVLNEFHPDKRQVFNVDRILHFTIDETPMPVYDLVGRYTYGVWSISPLESLKTIILWKHQALYSDILWRMRNVPREHHRLDLSVFDPSNYSGSLQERIRKAREDAQNVIRAYVEQLRRMRPDQGYVTSRDVEITYIEPRSATYSDPNRLLEQLSDYIYASLGIHQAAVRGRGASSYAAELVVKGYTGLVAQQLCRAIAEQLANQLLEPKIGEELEPIVYLELDIDRGERIRQVSLLAQLGICTVNELRQMLGLKPVEGGDRLVGASRPGRPVGTVTGPTPATVSRDEERQLLPFRYPDTPESRHDKTVA